MLARTGIHRVVVCASRSGALTLTLAKQQRTASFCTSADMRSALTTVPSLGAGEVEAVQNAWGTLKPLLGPKTKAMLVPGVFGCSNLSAIGTYALYVRVERFGRRASIRIQMYSAACSTFTKPHT